MAEKRFISPLTDFGFKRIFGNKDILLAFLNDLFEGEVQFTDLVYSDKEVKGDSEVGKTVIYDIHCTTSCGEKIIVEMQNDNYPGFRNRMVYYLARDIAKQGEAGISWNYVGLKAVYSIIFTNFELFKVGKAQNVYLRHDIKLVDITTNETFSDKLRMVCLQFPLTLLEPKQGETKLNSWMYNLKNMETMQQLTNTEDMPIFKRLEQVAEYHQLSPEDREAYDISYKHWLDAYNIELYHRQRNEEAEKRDVEMKKKQEEIDKKQEEVDKKQEEINKKQVEVEKQQEEVDKKQEEVDKKQVEVEKQQERINKQQDEIDRKMIEMKKKMQLANSIAESLQKGRAEGNIEGERKKQFEIAANMKTYGMPADQISLMTGLSAQEVESL